MSLNAPNHSLDHESTSELMIGLTATLGVISTVVVILRMYTRLVLLRNAGLDDLMIVVTQVHISFACVGINENKLTDQGLCDWVERLNMFRFVNSWI